MPDVGGLLHQLFVDAETTGGVDDHDIVQCALRLLETRLGDLDRIALAVAGLGCEHRDAGLLTDHLQLGDGIGTLEVGCHQHRRLALRLEPQSELAGERRLAGTLEAGEHDDGRTVLGVADATRLATKDRDELVVDDLDDLLGRVERLADLGARARAA